MIAFGRTRLSLVAAAATLVAFAPPIASSGDAVLRAGPPGSSTTTTRPDNGTTSTSTTASSTTGPDAETTSTAPVPTTTATTHAVGGASTTTAPPSTTSGPATTSTTTRTTTTTRPACPVGGLAWSVSFKGARDGELWVVTVTGETTNESDAAIEVGPITTAIETSPPSGSAQPREVQVDSEMASTTLPPGATEPFSGTRHVESTTNPKQGATVVGRRWADTAVRDRCPPP